MSDVDVDLLIRGPSTRRRWLLLALLAAVAVTATATYVLLQPGESEVVVEPERVEATTGQLSTTAQLTGSASAERSASLTFEAAGVVSAVEVQVGQTVAAGDALATLDDSDAQRRVRTAEVQLDQARLRLEDLLADPAAADIAAARQSVESAESQVLNAESALARLMEPASAADVASAEQAVANALAQVSSAEEALAGLREPPGAADVASAQQAVANALAQLSSAEEALAGLREPPGAADLASAEQAVANALGQLSSAEEGLATLLAGPSDEEIASAESAVTEAHAQLSSALSHEDASWDALLAAFEEYCDRYGHLNDVAESTCVAELPFTDDEVAALRDSIEGRSTTYQRYTDGLIDAHVVFITAAAAHVSAVTALGSAEARLADLRSPVSADDRYQAEQAVEAARASHAAAVARLADLRSPVSADDRYQAEQALEAARASHAAAVARLADLRAEPTEAEVFQAEQAVEAATANHAAAAARLEDLHAPPDPDDIESARSSLDGARAALVTAQARLDELMAGSAASAIAQQELSVQLVEISLDEARSALDALTVHAPFEGVVEAVNVQPGDRVAANLAAFSLSTSTSIVIDLTVTEADLLDLAVGQAGLASFDAVGGVEYPVRIASISRVPNAAQGVVTYDVQARLLVGPELAEVADELAALGGGGGLDLAGLVTSDSGTSDAGGRGGFGGLRGGAGGAAGPLAGLELPEGVTIQQVIEAVANGDPLPEGVTLPEGFEIPPQLLQRLAQGLLDASSDEAAPAQPGALAGRPLPAPGMTASVTILTELREQAVLVPVAAVRQVDGAWFVAVPAAASAAGGATFERVAVEVGASDGTSVEVTSGLDAGAVLLIGADSAGVAFSATQLSAQQLPAGGGFGPGGGFGGGGGVGGGGRP